MLSDLVARELQLDARPRDFCISLSGGVDSTVLLQCMVSLRDRYPLHLRALHINFGLRGPESDGDEDFCKALCDRLRVELTTKKTVIGADSAVQEKARAFRLGCAESFPDSVEWLEAHHADDQIETFFLRLLRGSSAQGLSGMKVSSPRKGKKVWRPFLSVSKDELRNYAESFGISYREDRTNVTTAYDRNFLRHEILPRLEERFPSFRKNILRTVRSMQVEDERQMKMFAELYREVVVTLMPVRIKAEPLRQIPTADCAAFLHRLVRDLFGATLSQEQTFSLCGLIERNESFTLNLPKDVIARGHKRQEGLELELSRAGRRFQQLGVTNEGLALY